MRRDSLGRIYGEKGDSPGNMQFRTPENAARICEMIVTGETLDAAAKAIGANSRTTILMWVAQDAEFEAMYRRAKTAQADAMAEQIIAIADDAGGDWKVVDGGNGAIVDREAVLRSKLRVETRLKLMASFAPKRYGAKVEVEHGVTEGFADRLMRARERAMAMATVSDPLLVNVARAADAAEED